MEKDLRNTEKDQSENNDFPGYPMYPTTEDIYSKLKEETDLDPEDTTKVKSKNEDPDAMLNEKNFKQDVTGGDLDIPGADLDDEQEELGSEDEENNSYSLGDNQ